MSSSEKEQDFSMDQDNLDQEVAPQQQKEEQSGDQQSESQSQSGEKEQNNSNQNAEEESNQLDQPKDQEAGNRATVCQYSIDSAENPQEKKTMQAFSGFQEETPQQKQSLINPFEKAKNQAQTGNFKKFFGQQLVKQRVMPILLVGESLSKETYDLDRMLDKNVQKRISVSGNRFDFAPSKSIGQSKFAAEKKKQNGRNFIKQNVNMVSQSRHLASPKSSQADKQDIGVDLKDNLVKNTYEKRNSSALNMVERLYSYRKNVEEKTKKKEEELNKIKFEECTFAPKTKQKDKEVRPFEMFLQLQEKHQRQKTEKLEMLREEQKEKEAQIMSVEAQKASQYICQGSKKILEDVGSDSQPVYEKLYEQGLEKMKREPVEPDLNFVPQIDAKSQNLKRDRKIQDILYEDAQNRKNRIKEQQQSKQHQNQFKLSKKSRMKLKEKIDQEVKENFQKTANGERLNYMCLGKFLQKLFFVVYEISNDKYQLEKQKIKIVWEELSQDDQGILEQNLITFLSGIMGYIDASNPKIQLPEYKVKQFGFLDGDKYEITNFNKLYKEFQLFRDCRNEMTKHSNLNPSFKSQTISQYSYSFKPQLCSGTIKSKGQSKTTRTEQQAQAHIDRLYQAKTKNETKLEEKKIEYQAKELSDCTFQPNADKPKCNTSTMKHKTAELYERHKQIKENKQKKEEEEKQKTDPSCTFQPNLEPSKKSIQIKQTTEVIKGIDTAIKRLQVARKEKEIISQIQERGFSQFLSKSKKDLKQTDQEQQKKDVKGQKKGETKAIEVKENKQKQKVEEEEEEEEEEESDQEQEESQSKSEENESEQSQEESQSSQQEESEEEKQPIVTLDINLGSRKERITIFEGDEVNKVADKFISHHKLDAKLKPRLIKLIQDELNNIS